MERRSPGEIRWSLCHYGAKQQLTPLSNTTFVVPGGTGAQLEFLEVNGETAALQLFGIAGNARLPGVRDGK